MADPTIRLNLNAVGVTQGARDVKAAFESIKTGAQQTEAATNRLGSAMQRMGNMSGAQRFVFQNTANQLGDIAVQASMGTNMFRVLGMQLPQVAGGFAILGGTLGTVAPILGVIAAIGFPIIAVFTQLGGKTRELSDELDKLNDDLSSASDAISILNTPTKELTKEFGEAAEAIKEFTRAQAELHLADARDQINLIGQDLSTMTASFEAFGIRGNRAQERVSDTMRELGAVAKLTDDQMEDLAIAFDTLSDKLATGNVEFEAVTTDGAALLAMFREMGISMKDLKDVGLQPFVNGLIDLGFEVARVEQLMETLERTSDDVAEALDTDLRVAVERVTFDIMRLGDGLDTLFDIRPEVKKSVADVTKDIMMFGDGLEDAFVEPEKKAKSAARSAAKSFRQELTPEVKRIVSLSEDIGSSFEDALMSVQRGTASVSDAFRAMATDIIGELYRMFVVKQITGFVTQSIQGMFGVSQLDQGISLRPQARPIAGVNAFGGPVTPSRGVVVGERGPEVFFPNTKGTIASNNQLGGGTVVVNQNINVTTGVQQTVRAEVLGLMPQIAEASKAAVLDAKRRGGSFAGAF